MFLGKFTRSAQFSVVMEEDKARKVMTPAERKRKSRAYKLRKMNEEELKQYRKTESERRVRSRRNQLLK